MWIVKLLLIHGDIILRVTALLRYNARQFITSINVRGDVILQVTVLLSYNARQFITLINVRGNVNFVGYCFVELQSKTIHYFDKRSWGRKFVGMSNPWNPHTLNPHEQ